MYKRQLANREKEIAELKDRLEKMSLGAEKLAELEKTKEFYESRLAEKDKEIVTLREKLNDLEKIKNVVESLTSEIQSYKEMVGTVEEVAAAKSLEERYTALLSKLKDEFASLRNELANRVQELSDIRSENKALKSQIDLLQEEINSLKNERQSILEKLEKKSQELLEAKSQLEPLKKKLDEVTKELEYVKSLPEEMSVVLNSTMIGKAYLMIRDIKKVPLDRLASTLGVNKLQLKRDLLKLVRLGLISIDNDVAVYTGAS